jgi:NAD(P)-dependent dehydrogenase (short-subunit alcohol dehydrogenase family)
LALDLKLSGKHVLITGGSKGIGYACAEAFLAEGCLVSIIGRDQPRLHRACNSLQEFSEGVSGFSADLSQPADALAALNAAENERGPIDILVNAAGGARRKPFEELRPEDWRAAMDAKFLTYMNVMDPLIKLMAQRHGGSVVNVVGMGGKIPITTHLAGGAANAALMLATAGLALAYGPMGVRVNALNPAKTNTDRLDEGVAARARQQKISAEEAMAEANSASPLGRLANPQEVAAVVAFLASPRAAYISGAIVSMDGGARPMVV